MADAATTDDGLVYSSDFHIKTLTIVTSDGQSVDIKNLAVEINLYEDIFAPCMSGSILMGDALDIVANFKMHGNEFIVLELDKPGLDKPIQKVFRIYKISDREFVTSSLQNYVIHFTSEENILSTQIYISKSYKGMKVSDMIADLLKNKLQIKKDKITNITPTEGVFDIIIPRMQPFEAIQWLTTRCYGKQDSLYFFFENRDGYNLVSYEQLLKQPVYTKLYNSNKLGNKAAENVNSANYFKIVQDFDIINSGRYGAFSSSLMTYDFINRKPTVKVLSATNKDILNKSIPVNDSKNRFNATLTASPDYSFKFYPTTDSNPLNNAAHPENWLQQKAAKLAQLSSFKLVISVPGDVLMKVGAIVLVEVPMSIPQDGGGENINTLRSGRYLVSSVHHIFMSDVMTTVLELLSDSMSENLTVASNSSQAIQDIRKA